MLTSGTMTDLTDKRLWRKVLARMHPDNHGDEELFKFLSAVKDHLDEQDVARKKVTGKGANKRMTTPVPPVGTRPYWEQFRR